MAFDAGMIAAVTFELCSMIIGAKVEKVQQPEKDQIVLQLRNGGENFRLLISAGSNNPRINLTDTVQENPIVAPMFCMHLRKHLNGSKIADITQLEFERAIQITFSAYDDLGFPCEKYLIVEIMGKYSNIIFCGKERKIINAMKIVDFTTSQKRQILPGMTYTMPPPQDKRNPLEETYEKFVLLYDEKHDISDEKFILNNYLGLSALTVREIVYKCSDHSGPFALWNEFSAVINIIKNKKFVPVLVHEIDKNAKPIEYSFFPISQYGVNAVSEEMPSFGVLIDRFFEQRDKVDRIKQRAADIFTLLSHAETRLLKKTELQKQDIASCAMKDGYKLYGDLITSSMYKIQRGMEKISLTNYYSENMDEIDVELDARLTPSQNAQRYYKRYNKSKTAEKELAKQITISEGELEYIGTVFDSLTKAENENDLNEIRHELYVSGYASRMKNYTASKMKTAKPMEFTTSGGYKLLVGKNNSQNDYITMKVASKNDYWFHVKNIPGSHVILISDGEEPSAEDFTEAASVAAYYSKARGGENIPVDYTLIKNIKKPGGSKPGFVIYLKNWTAYVTPDDKVVNSLKNCKK